MTLRFGDHASFHRAAVGMVGGSAVLGLALHPVTPLAPLVGGLLGLSAGAAFGYGKPVWRLVAAATAAVPLLAITPSWPVLAGVAGVLGLGLALGGPRGTARSGFAGPRSAAEGRRGVSIAGALSVMIAATVALLAMWSALRIGHAQRTVTWPAWATDLVSAAAMGMVGVLAMLPRHLALDIDPVRAAMRKLPTTLDGEVRGLCERSVAIWSSAKDRLADHAGKDLVRDGVLKTIEVAAKSNEIDVAGASDAELSKRMADLDARIAAASDAEIKAQYQSARSALEDQRTYRERIRQNRERMIARMHNHVAALEKFQLAASGLAAARVASSGQGAVQQLDELSQDVAASGEALAELEYQPASAV